MTSKCPQLTRQQLMLIKAADEIMQQPKPEDNDLCFLASSLVQCTLPHRSPGNVPAWSRRNGNLTLTIRPGFDHANQTPLGYPYGTIPRLLMFWISTEVTRKRSRKLELGSSLADFMRTIGLEPSNGSGKRSDSRRLKEQMMRLFRSQISFDIDHPGEQRTSHEWLDMPITSSGQFWWSQHDPEQRAMFGSYIELGEAFFESIIRSPVPFDVRAIRALKQSPLALDLYAFLSYRSYRQTRKLKPAFIPWRGLIKQIGSNYSDVKDFKRNAKEAIRKIELVQPKLRLTEVHGGITLHSPV